MIRSYKDNILAFVLAGGKGERLNPLTEERTKPSVPFGGKYRIIDFSLSNLVNSNIYSIYVLVQYKSQSLIEHIRTSWRKFGVLPNHFITVVPPQMRREKSSNWYRGIADSIYHNINLIYDFKPRLVAIFSGDHIYRMNIREMVDYHIRKKAQLTVSVIPIEAEEACQFGVASVDQDLRIIKFKEKPSASKSETVFASMGNYIFDSNFLIEVLNKRVAKRNVRDFGHDIIPYLVRKNKNIFAYDFSKNKIPFLGRQEMKYYWRDVGSILAYWQANMDLLGQKPKFDLDNKRWPIYATSLDYPPAYATNSEIENSLICEGTRVLGSKIKNSILGRSVIIEPGCIIEDSIIMDSTHIRGSCIIKKAIVDRFNTIAKNTRIGHSVDSNSNCYYDPSGIAVVSRGSRQV